MAALGELLLIVVYALLSIPVIIFLIKLLFEIKQRKKITKPLIWLLIGSVPLLLFSFSQYYDCRKQRLENVGVYYLTDYPKSKACLLQLNKNGSYDVSNGDTLIESGQWKYRSGGDYWIVDIGKYGQLGSGNYRYNVKKEIK